MLYSNISAGDNEVEVKLSKDTINNMILLENSIFIDISPKFFYQGPCVYFLNFIGSYSGIVINWADTFNDLNLN